LIKPRGEYIGRKLNTIGKEKMKIIDYMEPIVEEAFVIEVLLTSGAPLYHPPHMNPREWWGLETPFPISNIDLVLVCLTAGFVSLGEDCRSYVLAEENIRT
jgi:hypothetical protein